MATYSTEIQVKWGDVYFLEVTGLAWNYGGERQGRDIEWTANPGSVSVSCLSINNAAIENFGVREQLVITGGGVDISKYAAWESVAVAPEVNGVTRYTVTLKLLE